jgi:hypothetical protein
MNLVQLVNDQLSGDVVSKLTRLTGSGTEETKDAVGAAVPTLLAGMAHVASTPEGARKLNAAVDQVDDRMVSNPLQALGGAGGASSAGGGSLIDTGTRMLGSLFGGGGSGGGGGMIASCSAVIARFTGMSPERTAALLAALAPMILGVLKSRKQASGLDASGLAGLLAGQKQNIMGAMPSGMGSMLGSIPGLGALTGVTDRAKDAAGSAAEAVGAAGSRAAEWTRETAGSAYDAGRSATREVVGAGRAAASSGSSAWKWAIPLLLLVGLGLLAWRLVGSRNEPAPQALTSATPRNTVETRTTPTPPPPEAQPQPAAVPSGNNTGAPDATLAGAKTAASDTAANATDAAANATATVSTQLTDFFRSTTETFSKVTDPASAEQAMPKLRELNTKLDGIRSMTNNLPPSARSSISSMVTQSMEKLNPTIDKLLATPGVGEKIRPTVQEIRDKLNALAQPA